MEREKFFMSGATNSATPMWNSSSFGMGMQSNDLTSCFFNSNWENSMGQSDPFDSALSSIVSSPVASNASVIPSHGGSGGAVMIRELIGRLGTICNSGEISLHPYINNADNINNKSGANNSCYSTPLNSPPKLNLPLMDSHIKGSMPSLGNNFPNQTSLVPFPTDPVFAERAARYSCFGNRSLGGLSAQFELNQAELPHGLISRVGPGSISRVQSSNSMKVTASQGIVQESNKSLPQDGNSNSDKKGNPELDFNEKSSVSEQILDGEMGMKVQKEANPRKRKSIPRGKTKETPSPSPCNSDAKVVAENSDEPSMKRSKSDEANGKQKDAGKAKEEQEDGNQKKDKDSSKPTEVPKDYIHVRARRGQATDSHSLAERVRRERIRERMKFLQDLVPGCNKLQVTGNAVMLDEIINYVQSLQRQVEFLSMKLATVNPSLNFNMEALLSKQIFQSRGSVQNNLYPLDASSQAFPYGYQSQQGLPLQSGLSTNAGNQFSMKPLDVALKRNQSLQLPPFDGFADACRQAPSFWEDDLHSVVKMGYGQNQQQSFPGGTKSSCPNF